MPDFLSKGTQNYIASRDIEDSFSAKKTIADETAKSSYNQQRKAEPNTLFKFATYNALFTLSALTAEEITNPDVFMNAAPHDIIVRSGGIGGDARPSDELSAQNKGLLKSDVAREALRQSRTSVDDALDLYFTNVTIEGIPPLNDERRLTNSTRITMEITEPLGLSLIDKVRGAAANCNFLDHVDAPFLLTIEFKGTDENGKPLEVGKTETRKIPIKLVNMQLKINAGSSVYNLTCIPYNEFHLVNRFNYVRDEGTIVPGKDIRQTLENFAKELNQFNIDETDQDKFAQKNKQDTYEITIDDEFASESIDLSSIKGKGIIVDPNSNREQQLSDQYFQKPAIKKSDSVLKIITELMKSLPRFQDEYSLDAFRKKVEENAGSADASAEDFYFDYFFIDGNVVPDTTRWDNVRGTHPKKIKFHVTPHRVHAYTLAEPGVSTGTNFNDFVKKEYNYIYTGENVDILDLDIEYKVAYYASKLKDVPGENTDLNKVPENPDQTSDPEPTQKDALAEYPYIFKQEPAVITSVSAGVAKGGNVTRLDQLFDAISNPTADMVRISMNIIGDPAWLGQTQFVPANAEVGGSDVKKKILQGGNPTIWNAIYGNFDTSVGEPIIRLNFRTPADFDPDTGLYKLSSTENIMFSGLYRVVGCSSVFQDGRFTQDLRLVRTKSQGNEVYVPTAVKYVAANPHIESGKSLTVAPNEFKSVYQDRIIKIAERLNANFDLKTRVKKTVGNLYSKIKDYF